MNVPVNSGRVSKRLRFEVLRRDNHACRYCGRPAPEVRLAVDHVIPVALGGSSDPTNLITSCEDCNGGKSSTTPDAELVAEVVAHDARWRAALIDAARVQATHDRRHDELVEHFRASFDFEPGLPAGWPESVRRLCDQGATADDLRYGAHAPWLRSGYPPRDPFAYSMRVVMRRIDERQEIARTLIEEGGAE